MKKVIAKKTESKLGSLNEPFNITGKISFQIHVENGRKYIFLPNEKVCNIQRIDAGNILVELRNVQ